MRLTPVVTARNALRIAGRSAAGAAVLAISVSACTSGGSSVPSIFTPTPTDGSTVSSTHTPSPSGAASTKATGAASSTKASSGASATVRSSSPASATARGSASAAPTPSHTVTATRAAATPTEATRAAAAPAATATTLYPTAAPQTGGGGTAGLQDSLVFVVGGGAVLAGLGSLAYRRRLARKYGTRRTAREPLDREPADR
jgi:hypothetical protein